MEDMEDSDLKWYDSSIQDRCDYVEHLNQRWSEYYMSIMDGHVDCMVVNGRKEKLLSILQGVIVGLLHCDCGRFDENGDASYPVVDPTENDLVQISTAHIFITRAINLQHLQTGNNEAGTFRFDIMELEITEFLFAELLRKHAASLDLRSQTKSVEALYAPYKTILDISRDEFSHLMLEEEC